MTKRNLLLVSLLLVCGLVAMAPSALAQTQWTVGANQNQYARSEGQSESTGQITLSTSSLGTVGAGTEFIIYSTTQASPGGTSGSLTGNPVSVTNVNTVFLSCSGSGPWSSGSCTGLGTPFLTASANLRTPVASGPALHIPFSAPVIYPGILNPSFLSVTVRVNATPLYPAGGSVYAVVSAFTPTGVPNFTITPYQPSPSELVATVQPDPALSVGFGWWCSSDDKVSCELSSTAYVLQCLGVIHNSEQYERYFTVNVGENFDYALTSTAYEMNLDPGVPGSPNGQVTNPTIITVVLNNIPTNFGISADDTTIPCTEVTAPAVPCPTASHNLAVTLSGSDHYWNSTPGNTGTATFEYYVDDVDRGVPENVNLPFKFYSAGPLGTAPMQGLQCVTLTVFKNPENPPSTTAIPRFEVVPENGPNSAATGAQANPLQVICFNNCETNLLFPFVINYAAWDTFVIVANTTLDPLALIGNAANPVNELLVKGSATPQTGSCAMYYYTNGGLASGSPWSTGVIAPGSVYSADVGFSGLIPGLTQGYVWANCNFSQAYGYAAINYSFSLANGILADYLAVTIPDPEWSPRDHNGDGMGENSTTPINIERQLLKELAGFSGSGGCCGP